MNYMLDYYEFINLYNNCEYIDTSIIEELLKNSESPLKDLVMNINRRQDNTKSIEEQLKYIDELLTRIIELKNIEISDDEVNILSAYLLNSSNDNNNAYNVYSSVINADVSEDNWIWVIREHVRYTALSILMSDTSTNYSKIKEFIELLRPNKEKFPKMLQELNSTTKHTFIMK